MNSFFRELKQRKVYRVALGYAVVAWLAVQISATVMPAYHAPEWILPIFITAVALGFPVALVLAWAFEVKGGVIEKAPESTGLLGAANRRRVWLLAAVGLVISALAVGGYWIWHPWRKVPTASEAPTATMPAIREKSIAVLPFENFSEDKANAYFADGIQEEILTRLAKIADLKVISRTSTQRYESKPGNLSEIAKQLGVANILEGSVQKAGDTVRVSVNLIQAASDSHLWADTYDRKLTDIFAVESEIAKTIAETLQAKLTGTEKQIIAEKPTNDATAHELYLKGRVLWARRSGDNIPKAIVFFEQAIERDPNYALAYAGLADSYILLPAYTSTARRDALPKAKRAAIKALQLDDNLAEGHNALGLALALADLDFEGSIKEFQRAIALNPNYATAHHWYGNGPLIALGRFDEAIAEGRRAIELDPLSPIINADQGANLIVARRYDEAIAQLRKTIDIDPTFYYTYSWLGYGYQLRGDLKAAIDEYRKALKLYDDLKVRVALATAEAQAGSKDAAVQMLAELDQLAAHREIRPLWRAVLYISVGNNEEALRCLGSMVDDLDGGELGFLKFDPFLDPLRGDPRFDALVQKVSARKQ
jgi:TolB-like protein/Tfp pilus assembly protein PilF